MAEAPTTAYMLSTWGAKIEECARLRAVLDMIAESVIVNVWGNFNESPHITWGCGICQGQYLGRDEPTTQRGVYKHESWCPRKVL